MMTDRDTQIVLAALQRAASHFTDISSSCQAVRDYHSADMANIHAQEILALADNPAEVAAILATVPDSETVNHTKEQS